MKDVSPMTAAVDVLQMEIMPWDSLTQKLLSSMSAGQGPDIAGIHFQNLPQYATSGAILDLFDRFVAGSDLDPANFPPALVELLKVDGKFYGAPMNYATLMSILSIIAGALSDSPAEVW